MAECADYNSSCNKNLILNPKNEEEEDDHDHDQNNNNVIMQGGGVLGPPSTVVAGKTGGSFSERRAAKCGSEFNVPGINTVRFRSLSPLTSPGARSPWLTISPGISPAALLESPIMLPKSQALPSPTTGALPTPSINDENSLLNPVTPENGDRGSNKAYCLRFNSDADHKSQLASLNADNVRIFNNMVTNNSDKDRKGVYVPEESTRKEDIKRHHPRTEDDRKELTFPFFGMSRTSEDGYNWRKYGQKQVKGSVYPRSYYKCTYHNCQVKKKVERSLEGQITEIIYKGAHNHNKPQPNRRAPFALSDEALEMEGGGAVWRYIQTGSSKEGKAILDWRNNDRLERASSMSVLTDIFYPLSNNQGKGVCAFDSDLLSTLTSHDEYDGTTEGSVSVGGDDADWEESESTRRKKECCIVEPEMISRAVQEPRVVIELPSDVDVLEDGYRWRKYGQKVVKGNPNPRSYYKCTTAGCPVRKHVERASHNLKHIVVTYEGKHNHKNPAAVTSRQTGSNSGSANAPLSITSQPAHLTTLARNANVAPHSKTQMQDLETHFERKPEFFNKYYHLGGETTHFGASSIYPMKFPHLANTSTYASSIGMNFNHNAMTHLHHNHLGSFASIVPDFPITLPLNQNLSAARFGLDCGRGILGPVQSFPGGQLFKQEMKEDNIYDAYAPMIDQTNVTSSSAYHLVMENFL